MTIRSFGLAIAAVVAVALVNAPVGDAAGGTFSYVVTSNGQLSSVNYYDGMDELISETDGLDSTWSKTMASQATYQLTSISAQTNGTQVSCQIVKNGEVVDQQQAVGRFTVVTCSAA